jgi:hypothetical protein
VAIYICNRYRWGHKIKRKSSGTWLIFTLWYPTWT